ncbi:zinc-binding oxidoreductase ToxD [Vararia minispora EC-137]|uniref:Zinc-binding oxidoreductase ToxD n=1 Tax=Vararia minispora EC-137 TaxID=1314806 RepID=A0ACB8QXZ8_9AGAM|nr:zinc-binding oxidoreductase ToxD [Vararia minispora EC-137]
MAPAKHLAAVIREGGGFVEVKEVDVPKPGENQVLVRVIAASLNPTDWKTAKPPHKAGNVSGCDFAGIVEELGPGAEATRKVGERVATLVTGGRSGNGSYAQYVVAKADFCMTIPDSWSFEDAAQLPIAVYTANQCLYQSLRFTPPPAPAAAEPTPILVYGASSSVGCFVLQFARLGGLKVYATCSPKNYDLVRGFGADEVFDYRDPDAAKKIKEATGGKLKHAVDCISEWGSDKFISDALSDDGGKVAIIVPYNGTPRPNIQPIHSLAYDFILDRKSTGVSFIPDGPGWAKLNTDLLAQGKIRPAPIQVMPHGIASVNDAFQYMIDGKVSGVKLIFRISDTPGLQ